MTDAVSIPSIPLVAPSHLRAGSCLTPSYLPQLKLAVPASQASMYRAAYPDHEVVSVPDVVRGISLTRQWIYEYFGDVFMIDDDVDGVFRLYGGPVTRLSPDEVQGVVDGAAWVARQMGAYLFGFASADARSYKPQDPLGVSGLCLGFAMGLLRNSRIHFDERASLSEDVYASCVNAHYHRFAYFDRRFGFRPVNSSKTPGGCAAYRTQERERENFLFLRRMFGSVVVLKRPALKYGVMQQTTSPWSRTVLIPF